MITVRTNFKLRTLAAIILSLGLIACGGGQLLQTTPDVVNQPQQPGTQNPGDGQPVADGTDTSPELRETNVLAVDTPLLAGMSTGSEFEVTLSGRFTEEVYQGSFRLLFDPAVMEPIESSRGDLLHSGMLHIAGLNQQGFVPFSFTALPGDEGISPGEGELLNLRFKLLGQPRGNERVRLQNDAEFLQLRNRNSGRLRFDLETRSGGAK